MHANAHADGWPLPDELSDPMPVAKGVVIESGVRLPSVSFITRGRMRLLTHLPGVREVRLTDLTAGATFGLVSAILDEPACVSAVALELCTVRSIAARRLRELVESNVLVTRWIARALARETRRLEIAVARFGASADLRLQVHMAELLVEGVTVLFDGALRLSVAPSQNEIAQAIGVTRQHVSHLLADAEADNVIRRHKGRYVIPAGSPVLALRDALLVAGGPVVSPMGTGPSMCNSRVNDLRPQRQRSD